WAEFWDLSPPRCVPLWVGARGVEFDWRHLQMGLDSNISLVRTGVASSEAPPLFPLSPRRWAGQALGLGPWGALGLRALGAAALGLGALRLLVPLLPPP
ncbi:TM147 protein, partial [Irena cyanogastra]|nr:TM147 protein [Irena cyanogastra]